MSLVMRDEQTGAGMVPDTDGGNGTYRELDCTMGTSKIRHSANASACGSRRPVAVLVFISECPNGKRRREGRIDAAMIAALHGHVEIKVGRRARIKDRIGVGCDGDARRDGLRVHAGPMMGLL
jgi:hypothetical protein